MATENFPHDAAYKAFFSNPDMVKSLLVDFVPEEFVEFFDFDTLEECPGSYTTSGLQKRHDDIVWRVRWRDTWCYVYILLEFQSAQDNWMALRILTYTALLWEELIKDGQIRNREKLPPVLPIVIYNGDKPWTAPTDIKDLLSPTHDKLSDYQPAQKYFLIDENRISRLLLNNASGESAYIFRLEQAKTAEEILSIAREITVRLADNKFDFLRRAIYGWISCLIRKKDVELPASKKDDVENIAMLEQRIAQWEQEFIQKGRMEGMLIGQEKGKAEGLSNQKNTLLEMLSMRFGEVPAFWKETINSITCSTVVSRLTISLLTVKSAGEFGELLAQIK